MIKVLNYKRDIIFNYRNVYKKIKFKKLCCVISSAVKRFVFISLI